MERSRIPTAKGDDVSRVCETPHEGPAYSSTHYVGEWIGFNRNPEPPLYIARQTGLSSSNARHLMGHCSAEGTPEHKGHLTSRGYMIRATGPLILRLLAPQASQTARCRPGLQRCIVAGRCLAPIPTPLPLLETPRPCNPTRYCTI